MFKSYCFFSFKWRKKEKIQLNRSSHLNVKIWTHFGKEVTKENSKFLDFSKINYSQLNAIYNTIAFIFMYKKATCQNWWSIGS